MVAHQPGERLALLGRIVDHQHAIHAGRARGPGKGLFAHALDRVGVAHQHHRGFGIGLAELAHPLQHLRQRHALRQRALGGALDHRAVGHRVGERHAQLDHVGAARHQRVHQRHGQAGLGIAGGDERNQALLLLRGQCRERLLDTGHIRESGEAAAPARRRRWRRPGLGWCQARSRAWLARPRPRARTPPARTPG
ncbi:hypothetical protein D3C81_1554410 [compost metagenome]